MYEEICTRDHFVHQASKKRSSTDAEWKTIVDTYYQRYLEKVIKLEEDTYKTWTDNHQYRETQQAQGEDPWWLSIDQYKVSIESRGEDPQPYFIISPPKGLCKRAKRSNHLTTEKHQNPKPKQRATPQKCLQIDTKGK